MNKILVPLDCSPPSDRVVALAEQIARAFGAALHLVHVREMQTALPAYPPPTAGVAMPEMTPIGMTPLSDVDIAAESAAVAADRAKLTAWRDSLSARGIEVTLEEPTGSVVEEVLKRAEAVSADMIVMGSHGHGAMYNLLVGSVTEGVLKGSRCPILLVPAGNAKP